MQTPLNSKQKLESYCDSIALTCSHLASIVAIGSPAKVAHQLALWVVPTSPRTKQAFAIPISQWIYSAVRKQFCIFDYEVIHRPQSSVCTAYPGPPSAPKVLSASKKCIKLTWTPPADTGGTNILGYNLEKRKKGSNLWGQVNPQDEMIRGYSIIHTLFLFDRLIAACYNTR